MNGGQRVVAVGLFVLGLALAQMSRLLEPGATLAVGALSIAMVYAGVDGVANLSFGRRWRRLLQTMAPLIVFAALTLAALTAAAGRDSLYRLFARWGAPALELDGVAQPFGDLRHLTEAAGCGSDLTPGAVHCDPWGRLFNQNPQVAETLAWLGLDGPSTLVLGIAFAACFFLGVAWFARVSGAQPMLVLALLVAPVAVTAYERGNETLSMGLVLIAFAVAGARPWLAAGLLLLASWFKVWPIAFALGGLLVKRRLWLPFGVATAAAALYWVVNRTNLEAMLGATERGAVGDPAFGLPLLGASLSSEATAWVGGLAVVGGLLVGFVTARRPLFAGHVVQPVHAQLVTAATAIALVFVAGTSWSYRLLVAAPLLIVLASPSALDRQLRRIGLTLVLSCLWLGMGLVTLPVTTALFAYATVVMIKGLALENALIGPRAPVSAPVDGGQDPAER